MSQNASTLFQLVVIHLKPPNNDLVLSLTTSKGEDLIGELVGIFGSRYQRMVGRKLDVQVLVKNSHESCSSQSDQSIELSGDRLLRVWSHIKFIYGFFGLVFFCSTGH